MISWMIFALATVLAAVFYRRMKERAEDEASAPDEGQAILDFNRAFPAEAIRSIQASADGRAFFVRLHDGKAGFMLSQGTHFICHLMAPGKVDVADTPSGQGLALRFREFPTLDGTYEFSSAETAADVSLWILGSFAPGSAGFTPIAAD